MDYRLPGDVRAALIADLDDLASRAGGILSRATRPRTVLRDLQPWVEPVPTPATIVGACPLTGGMTATAAQRVTDRWGQGVALRLFSSSGWTQAPAVPGAARILASWKPTLGSPLDPAQVLTALAPLPAGSKVTVWHEPDVKVRKGAALAPMADAHRQFAAIVRDARPDLVLTGILSAWTWQAGYDPAAYIDPAAFDVLGVDLDGADTSAGTYADYRPVADQVLDWMDRAGITRWTVPEFGLPRATGDDGTRRAAWMVEQVAHLRTLPTPPEDVALFESTAYPGTELTATVEQDAWRSLLT